MSIKDFFELQKIAFGVEKYAITARSPQSSNILNIEFDDFAKNKFIYTGHDSIVVYRQYSHYRYYPFEDYVNLYDLMHTAYYPDQKIEVVNVCPEYQFFHDIDMNSGTTVGTHDANTDITSPIERFYLIEFDRNKIMNAI